MKRCVFCGGPIMRLTQTRWKCGSCGLPYGGVLMLDNAVWSEFRRRAAKVLTALRVEQSDEKLRPMIGATLAGIVEQMGRDRRRRH